MITVVVPTRGRPGSAAELTDTFYQTIHRADTQLELRIDEDDPARGDYAKWWDGSTPALRRQVRMLTGPRLRVGPTLNSVARYLVDWDPLTRVIGFMGDDHRPRTPGWDEQVVQALDLRPGVAYGDDLVHGPNLPTAAFVSAELVRALGYIVPAGLIHLYLDNFWLELGRETNLAYLPGMTIEHMHPIVGKGPWDDGYAEVNSGAMYEHDRTEYERYMRDDWPTEKGKLHGSAAIRGRGDSGVDHT